MWPDVNYFNLIKFINPDDFVRYILMYVQATGINYMRSIFYKIISLIKDGMR